jgi:hypothetical protein
LEHARGLWGTTGSSSGVARPQATGALAWGVEVKPFVTVAYIHCLVLFTTVSKAIGLGRDCWLATLLGSRVALGALRSWLVVFDGVVASAPRTTVSTAREADWRWLGEWRPGGQSSEERMVGGLRWSGRQLRAPEP